MELLEKVVCLYMVLILFKLNNKLFNVQTDSGITALSVYIISVTRHVTSVFLKGRGYTVYILCALCLEIEIKIIGHFWVYRGSNPVCDTTLFVYYVYYSYVV